MAAPAALAAAAPYARLATLMVLFQLFHLSTAGCCFHAWCGFGDYNVRSPSETCDLSEQCLLQGWGGIAGIRCVSNSFQQGWSRRIRLNGNLCNVWTHDDQSQWGCEYAQLRNQRLAQRYCENKGARLPTWWEIEQSCVANDDDIGGCGLNDKYVWSSTRGPEACPTASRDL